MPLTLKQSSRLTQAIRRIAGGVSVISIVSLVALGWYQRRETLDSGRARLEVMARVLEDHATRSVESADMILRTLADGLLLQQRAEATQLQSLQPLLSQALLAQPMLRGIAVLDLQGQVLASSDPREQGLRLNVSMLGQLPQSEQSRLLPLLPGRGLRTLGDPALGKAVGMLPLVRRVPGVGGRDVLLLALINPDALANYQQTTLADEPGSRAALTSYGGQLLAGTAGVTQTLGALVEGHPVLHDLLPRHEVGSYVGAGLGEGRQVVAFRASRSRPLMVVVEQDERAALQSWFDTLWVLIGAGIVGQLLVVGVAKVLLRSLRVREQVRRQLDQAHEQVALREREMSVLLKSVQELIFRTDAKGRLSFVNARGDMLNEGRLEAALGQPFQNLVEPEDRESVAALFADPDRGGLRGAEVAVRTAGGIRRHFQLAVSPLLGQGRAIGFAGSAIDITERRDAEQRLQGQLDFTELLLEMSPQPISMFDAKGRYVTVNRAWEELTGRDRRKVIGQKVGFFLSSSEQALHETQDRELRESGGRVRYETRLMDRKGRLRDMLVTKVVVPDLQNQGRSILCTITDVTEFRAAERATRDARDAAEEASQAKSEFIANISHELRTPLQSILGFSELGMTRGGEPKKLAGMFGDIHASGQRMLALVNDLLDVSKIESSVGTFDLERTDLRHLIESVTHELDPLLARRSLSLATRTPSGPLVARVDLLKFQQVIRNVLANAIKFSPMGGEIQLSAGYTPDNEIHISIADRGPGIPPGEVDKIFEAFIQSSTTKDGSGGTGLGLAISRKIVEIHGGRIHAENREGGGACFHIYLPPRQSGETQPITLI